MMLFVFLVVPVLGFFVGFLFVCSSGLVATSASNYISSSSLCFYVKDK